MKLKSLFMLLLVLILAGTSTGIVMADNVDNDVAVVNNIKSITLLAGDPASVANINFYVQPTGSGTDGDAGCNFDTATEHLTFQINTPQGITANPSTITFNKCHDGGSFYAQPVTFSANASAVTGDLSFTEIENTSGGSFNFSAAVVTIYVNPGVQPTPVDPTPTPTAEPTPVVDPTPEPPLKTNQAPVVSILGVSDGASYEVGSVPSATCSVSDAEDGSSSFAATLSAISGSLSGYGLGSQTASCAYTDLGGLSASAAASYSIVDTAAPAITFVNQIAPANLAGWNNAAVTVNWSCSDNVAVVSASVSASLTGEGAGQSATGICQDVSGNTASQTVTPINIDMTLPTVTGAAVALPNALGWYNQDVTVHFTALDSLSGIASAPADQVLSAEGLSTSSSAVTASDLADNISLPSNVVSVKLDKTAPTVSAAALTLPNASGWYKQDVTVRFTALDSLSGIASAPVDQVLSTEGLGISSTAVTVADNAGNSSLPSNIVTVNLDKTKPGLTWNGGPASGSTNYYGFVPAAPTCTASDALSGPAGCTVSGFSSAIGSYTMTATAYDLAGNSYSETRSYSVLAWSLNGFYQPVDMNGVYNTVKNGSTVPLKFELFAGPTELKTTDKVKSLTYAQTACSVNAITDDIETLATGSTALRFDSTADQFVYNWKTPSTAGLCYRVTMTAQDGSTLSAYFKMK